MKRNLKSAMWILRGGFSSTWIGGDLLEATEDLECGISFDSIFLAEIRFSCAVDLYEGDVFVLQRGGSFFVLWG
jgi:hypothetical protein